MIHDVLGSTKLPTNLTENIVQRATDMNPVSPPAGKPALPWAAFGAATVLVIKRLVVLNAKWTRPEQNLMDGLAHLGNTPLFIVPLMLWDQADPHTPAMCHTESVDRYVQTLVLMR